MEGFYYTKQCTNKLKATFKVKGKEVKDKLSSSSNRKPVGSANIHASSSCHRIVSSHPPFPLNSVNDSIQAWGSYSKALPKGCSVVLW